MSIEFRCGKCSRLLRTDDDTVGRMAQCPECGAQTRIPESGAADTYSASPSTAGGSTNNPPYPESVGHQGGYQTYSGRGQGPAHPPADPLYALKKVSAPAVCLIVTAVLGFVLSAMRVLGSILKIGFVAAAAPKDFMPMLFIGPIAIIIGIIGIIMGFVVLYGAMKMKSLENYGFAMTASILAMIPCISPCCLLGLPFGIWAIVVLSDPVVKASFKS